MFYLLPKPETHMGWSVLTWRIAALFLLLASYAGCNRLNVSKPPIISKFGSRLQPSNSRDWKPEQAQTPFTQSDGSRYRVHNIRNCSYLSTEDYVVDYFDRTIDLSQIQSVDFIVVPFNSAPALAHTMISFGLNDGTYLAVSVEVRKEKGEKFNAFAGAARTFELMYVVGEERDLIRLRTKHYDANVFVFPTVATPEQSRRLFVDITERMNGLATNPEFYHSITNNCTTNLADHVNRISPERIAYGWQVLMPGFSAKYAYDIGLLDNRIPFEDLESIAQVNSLAERHYDDPQFSNLIRSRRHLIDRYLERAASREPTMDGRGGQLLSSEFGTTGRRRSFR